MTEPRKHPKQRDPEQRGSFKHTWTRGPDGSFNDIQKEKFAIQLASSKSVAESARMVGINIMTAHKWAGNEEMQERKRTLRATPAISQTFQVSIAMIVAELYQNAKGAREAEQFKASNDALEAMYRIAKNEKSLLETFEAQGEEVMRKEAHDISARIRRFQGAPIEEAPETASEDAGTEETPPSPDDLEVAS